MNNSADSQGGAIHVYGSSSNSIQVESSLFVQNSAGSGGALYSVRGASKSILVSSEFLENSALQNGGAVYTLNGMTIGCRFDKNSAGSRGGAIYHGYNGDGPIVSSLFAGNEAEEGGALYNEHASQTVTNCTLVSNTAKSLGGAIMDSDCSSSIANTILWANRAANDGAGHHILSSNKSTTVSYSLLENGCQEAVLNCGDGNDEDNPAFVDMASGDYHLSITSPAVETGDNDLVPADLTDWNRDGRTSDTLPYDLDKNPRIVNADNIGAAAVDKGAYEYQPL